MFKEFLMRKMMQSKLGILPKEEQEKVIGLVTKNPELFQEIAMKIKLQVDGGKDQTSATMDVMNQYQGQIQKLTTSE